MICVMMCQSVSHTEFKNTCIMSVGSDFSYVSEKGCDFDANCGSFKGSEVSYLPP